MIFKKPISKNINTKYHILAQKFSKDGFQFARTKGEIIYIFGISQFLRISHLFSTCNCNHLKVLKKLDKSVRHSVVLVVSVWLLTQEFLYYMYRNLYYQNDWPSSCKKISKAVFNLLERREELYIFLKYSHFLELHIYSQFAITITEGS